MLNEILDVVGALFLLAGSVFCLAAALGDQAASARAMSPSMEPPENSVWAISCTESGSDPASVSL